MSDRELFKSFRDTPREASLVDQAWMRRAISDPLTNRAFNMDGCTPPSAAAQPEVVGWKLVPIEPTPAMWTAGGRAIKGCGAMPIR